MSPSVILSSFYDDNVTFDKPHLILVEGADDQAVIAAMIRHETLEGFQVHNMSGKSSWGARVELIAGQPEFSVNVQSFGLVKDADTSPDAAWDSCTGVLQRCSLPVPTAAMNIATGQPSTAIMIVPSRSRQGAIEELCIDSFDESRSACVVGYFECLSNSGFTQTQAKGYVQAYLAGLETAPRDLKVASDRGKLDMADQAFDELRSFVRILAGTVPAAGAIPDP
jgi:hypothetical protein